MTGPTFVYLRSALKLERPVRGTGPTRCNIHCRPSRPTGGITRRSTRDIPGNTLVASLTIVPGKLCTTYELGGTMKVHVVKYLLIGLALVAVVGCRTWEESNSSPPAFDNRRFDADPLGER